MPVVKKKVRGHITETDKDFTKMVKSTDKYIRLDIACGNNKKEGFIGIDITRKGTEADWECDLEKYPWKVNGKKIPDSSVGEVFCSHYIEHVSDLRKFAAEMYRICAPQARVTLLAPYFSSIRAMQDPTHKNFISECTFLYWNKGWLDMNKLSHYNMNCNFAIIGKDFVYSKEWALKSDEAKEYARQHYINVVADITVKLQAIKEK